MPRVSDFNFQYDVVDPTDFKDAAEQKMRCAACSYEELTKNFLTTNFVIGRLGELYACPKCGTARFNMLKVVEVILNRGKNKHD